MREESTVRYLGIEVDDALEISEHTEIEQQLSGAAGRRHDGLRVAVFRRDSGCVQPAVFCLSPTSLKRLLWMELAVGPTGWCHATG